MRQKFTAHIINNLGIVVPVIVFLVLTAPYWGEVPALDQLIIYRESIIFLTNGLQGLVATGYPVHPPLLYILYGLALSVFGKGIGAINLLGFIVYFATLLGYSSFSKKIFGLRYSITTSILFFCSPLMILHSFYLSNDFLILSGLVYGILFIYRKKWIGVAITVALMVLMKETALLIACCLVIISGITIFSEMKQEKSTQFKNLMIVILPSLAVFLLWRYMLAMNHAIEWHETGFGVTESSSLMVVLNTLLKGKIFSRFMAGNLYNAFLMNYQWLITGISIAGLAVITFSRNIRATEQRKWLFCIFAVTFFYSVPAKLDRAPRVRPRVNEPFAETI